MDAIEPILSHPSLLPEVRAAQRSEPVHRDGHRRDGGQGEQRRRRDEEEAVEVDVDGVDASEEADDGPSLVLQAPVPRLIDVTADGDPEPPARRVDLTDDDEPEAPASRIDLSA
jgi:hypothetical protein